MSISKEIVETELHKYFEEIKPLLLEKEELLEQENLSVQERVSINLDFIKKATLLFLPVLKSFVLNPLKSALKTGAKEMKIFGSLGMISIVLFVFFTVGWFTLTVLVGVWFYEEGNSLSLSVLYSLIFQLFSFLVVASVGYIIFSKSIFVSFYKFFKQKETQIDNDK
jgi:hypothetical protein